MDGEPRVLGDRYELRSVIATGGMGRVWRAHDRRLRRAVAVKVLRGEFAGDPEFLARFRAEARHTALLRDEHIAAVFDYGETETAGEQLAYLVMELIEGEPLSVLRRREGALEPGRAIDLLRQAAAGLAVAHGAGVVHRDVKPGNLLVRADDTLTITDFGIAWSAASVALTGTGEVIGTAHYLSPEQAQGKQATAASDVYALGMVGYELLAGHRAFEGENSVAVALRQIQDEPAALPGDVPAGARELIDAMLVKDPGHRLADGAAVVAAAERLVQRGLGPATVKLVAPAVGGRSRRRVLVGAAATAAVAGAAVLGSLVLGGGDDVPATEAAEASSPAGSSAAASSSPVAPPVEAGPGWTGPAPLPAAQLGSATGTGLGQVVPTTPTTTAAPTTTSSASDDDDDDDDGRFGDLEDLFPDGWPFPTGGRWGG